MQAMMLMYWYNNQIRCLSVNDLKNNSLKLNLTNNICSMKNILTVQFGYCIHNVSYQPNYIIYLKATE